MTKINLKHHFENAKIAQQNKKSASRKRQSKVPEKKQEEK